MKPHAYYSHFFTSTSQLEVPAVSEGCLALRQDLRRSFRCGTLCHVDRKVPLQNESVLGYVWRISIIETYLQHFQSLAVSKNRGKVQLEVSENRSAPNHSF